MRGFQLDETGVNKTIISCIKDFGPQARTLSEDEKKLLWAGGKGGRDQELASNTCIRTYYTVYRRDHLASCVDLWRLTGIKQTEGRLAAWGELYLCQQGCQIEARSLWLQYAVISLALFAWTQFVLPAIPYSSDYINPAFWIVAPSFPPSRRVRPALGACYAVF